jgi:hypothetical protein
MKILDPMNQASVRELLTFEYASLLAPGETVASAALDVSIWNAGEDSAPSALLDGSPVLLDSGATVGQRVTPSEGGSRSTGGVDGVDYAIRCVATTTGVSPTREIVLVSILPIRNV